MTCSMAKPHMDRLLWFNLEGFSNPSKLVDLKKKLTVYKKFSGDKVLLYELRNGSIGIPIHHFPLIKLLNAVDDNRIEGRPITMQFKSDYWEGQEEVVDKFTEHFYEGCTGFILKAPTGWGKTAVCIKFISIIKKTTLVVVPREDLVQQWVGMFEEHSTIRPSQIGKAIGGKLSFIGKKVVIALVHTLILDRIKNNQAFINQFGLVLFDEVDRSVPPATFSAAASLFPAKYRIGVSAELKRADGLDQVFKEHVGQCTIVAKGKTRMKPKAIIHYFHEDSGYVHEESSALNRRGMFISRVANNNRRNLELCKYAKLIHKSGRQCLIVSDRVAQLQTLERMLISEFDIPMSDTGFYVGHLYSDNGSKIKVKKEDRRRVAKECKIILGTYGKISIGTDIKSLAGLILATPQSRIVQTLGRILRQMEGKQTPVVVDFVDTFYEDAVGWAFNRKRHYYAEEIFIKEVGATDV